MSNETTSRLSRAMEAADRPLLTDDEFAIGIQTNLKDNSAKTPTIAGVIGELDFRLANARSARLRIETMNDILHGSSVQNSTGPFPPKPEASFQGPALPRVFGLLDDLGAELARISKELTKLESFIKV